MGQLTFQTTIRLAEPRDLEAVAALAVKMRDETHWKDVQFTPNPEAAAIWMLAVLSMSPDYMLYVAEDYGKIVGFCLGILTAHPFVASVPIVAELGWYVLPEYRQTGIGWRLWEEVVAWGNQLGAKAASYHKPFATKQDRYGFHAIEVVYWRDLEAIHG